MSLPLNPKPFLNSPSNDETEVWYGIQGIPGEEYTDGALSGHLGEVLIRCNNVFYIRGVEEEEEDGKMRE
ncbi:hypothetical protein AB205_0128610 [Aquarana catesbeiana]|uniref:Uncharacterized protein n=1 Tax=Aquarana catesbeiana TaxID=8400 RepID=A0A2G9REF3_AQUCT|nr:hypothetical protein AB205_0128610 [Aquarana catesbeiana]